MLNLFEKYTGSESDLEFSLNHAGYNNKTIVLEDDGYLPSHIDSPISFFTSMNKISKKRLPKYFNEVIIPVSWEIIGDNQGAEIFDGYKKKANIVYSNRASDFRIIKNIEWLNEEGGVRTVDMYNQYGILFGKRSYSDGVLTLTSYFDENFCEVVLINHITDTVQVYYQGKEYVFETFFEFVYFYFEVAQLEVDKIFYNSLGKAHFITIALQKKCPHTSYEHTLFWQEQTDEIPGNMKNIFEDEEGPTKHIIVQNHDEYLRIQNQVEDNLRISVDYLGVMYDFKRQVNLNKSIFILTNSDEIPQLELLITLLPDYQIRVAACTEMSSKLMAYNRFSNVFLYPSITTEEIQDLVSTSSIYLDINKGSEVVNIIRVVFEHNLLIFGFEETLHNTQFVDKTNVFKIAEAADLARAVTEATQNLKTIFESIGGQWLAAGQTTIDEYKEVLK